MLETAVQNKVNQWLQGSYDAATKATIQKLIDDNNTTSSPVLFPIFVMSTEMVIRSFTVVLCVDNCILLHANDV